MGHSQALEFIGNDMRYSCLLFVTLMSLLFAPIVMANTAASEKNILWAEENESGQVSVHLYFFWSRHCPHCRDARSFVEKLPSHLPFLTLHSLEVGQGQPNDPLYTDMASALGEKAQSVPAFLFCGTMTTGYGNDQSTGEWLTVNLKRCHSHIMSARHEALPLENQAVSEGASPAPLPLIGDLDLTSLSLPTTTLILAAIDSFNPCAFFVLLFLLSLLIHARSRTRMLIMGVTFVVISGLTYFLFMSAWLSLFLLSAEIRWVTLIAGAVAILIAVVNIKDFFWFKQGVSLSITDQAKNHLLKRMRRLISARSLPTMLLGTITLAVVANSYELLCTAGFPMVFTRILTMHALTTSSYYAYLALYNSIYIIPLLLIVVVFSYTLGSKKLTEAQGRSLKLLSGLMMLGLGIMLVFAPNALNNPVTAILLLAAALTSTWVLYRYKFHRASGS